MSGKVISIVVGNIVSKGLGVFREILFANWFGTGDVAAAFRIAQTGFLMPTHSLIGDTLSAGLLPLYQKLRREEGDGHRILLIGAMLYGAVFSAITTTAILVYAEMVTRFIAPGASDTALQLATTLLRILGLATPFYVFSGMMSYLETAYGSYGAIAWRPSLLNIGSTVGVALAALLGKEHWLATALLVAHIVFFVWSAVMLARLDRLMPSRMPPWRAFADVWTQLLRNMVPLFGLPLIAQTNVLVERMVSSWIGTAVIPGADYARLVTDTAVQLVAVPLGVLTMSKHGGSTPEDVRQHVTSIAASILVLAIPPGIFIATYATSVTRLLFARGAFGDDSVAVTSAVLTWTSAALAATVLAYYLIKALNAQLRNVEALWCTLLGCGVNIAFNLTLWRVFGAATIGAAAAAGSVAMLLLAIIRLNLVRGLLPVFGWLALGAVLASGGGRLVSGALAYPYDLFSGAAWAVIAWLGLIGAVPRLRALFLPIIRGVLRRRG